MIVPLVAVLTLVPTAARASAATEQCVSSSDLGQKERDEGKLREAREHFVLCARSDCPPMIQNDCAGWLTDVQARIPTVVLTAKDDAGEDLIDVKVAMDGKPLSSRLGSSATPIDPGEHVFRFEWRDAPPIETRILAREGEQRRVVLATFKRRAPAPLPPPREVTVTPPPSRHIPAATWILGGAAVLSLGSFSYFYPTGLGDRRDLERTCAPRCEDAQVDPARTKILIADISLAVAAVAAVSAIVVYFASSPSPTASSRGSARGP